jgi:AcrR family transcriptional regulator
MNRGQRVANKTKSVIKNALIELIREKNYPAITVNEITERGNIGRSTLYKHYRSKADVLVDIHKDAFEQLFSGLSTLESWLAPEPPSELISFFERYRRLGKNPFSLSYKLGSDLDYLMNTINFQLAAIVEDKLRPLYNEANCGILLPVLAHSISILFSGLTMYWFNKLQTSDTRKFATNMHRMIRALIFEAFGESTITNK